MMKESTPAQLREAIISIAREAGDAILQVYHSADFDVSQKDDKSPLTAADLAAHHLIISRLAELTPKIPILSEESASIPAHERRAWQRYWLVDPLDGTREFIKRNGEFTVNIALIENAKSVLGVVHVPVQGLTYSGAVQAGAFRQQATEAEQPIRVREPHADPLRVVGSRSHASPSQLAFAENCGAHEMIAIGSSIKLCLVAAGDADVYPRFGPTSEWDTAAAQCVVEQAGGRVVQIADPDSPLLYNSKDSLLNPFFLVYGDKNRDWQTSLKSLPTTP